MLAAVLFLLLSLSTIMTCSDGKNYSGRRKGRCDGLRLGRER